MEWPERQQEHCEGARGCDQSGVSSAEAVGLLKQVKYAKFDETVDLTLRLGVDTRHATKWCAGRLCCRTAGQVEDGGRDCHRRPPEGSHRGRADFVGGEEMVEKIQKESWTASTR